MPGRSSSPGREGSDARARQDVCLRISAKIASGAVRRKDFRAIAQAVRETAGAQDQQGPSIRSPRAGAALAGATTDADPP
ncbi:hypothetical protein ACLMAL_38540 [Nocardia sp. CWNU-33]|uniref:hypothetical protein n=1 Tax=Nocardia sp. CWNU-33 TaxID=3392117 RepID=UPI00398F3382